MMMPKVLSYATTVALLVWMGFFMMGSLPLLILKHDTPLDSRFIRGLFNVYYLAVMVTASVSALCFSIWGRVPFAMGMATIALLGGVARRVVLTRMDHLRAVMTGLNRPAIRRFRQTHIAGMLLNVANLAVVCFGLMQL